MVLTSNVRNGAGIVALSAIFAVLAPVYISPHAAHAGALVVLAIGLWATGALPEHLTTLIVITLALVFKLASERAVFSGFESSTFWLIFGGLISGGAIRYTGLGRRIASWLTDRLGASHFAAIASVVLLSCLLSFIMPSATGRSVLIIPIASELARRLGYAQESNGRIGIMLAAAFGTNLPSFAILPANVPNMILAGSAETMYRHSISYADYLLLHFPVLGLLKSLVLIGLIVNIFPDGAPQIAAQTDREPPITRPERHLLALLGLSLLLWMTDSIHHVSPGWISLAGGLYCLWPGSGLTSSRSFDEDINFRSLFFVAGVMGVGAIVSESGLGALLVGKLNAIMGLSTGAPIQSVLSLAATSSMIGMLTTLPGVPAVLTPVAGVLATRTGLSLDTVLMAQVLGFSSVLLPYVSPPLMVAIQLGRIPLGAATKLSVASFVATLLVLMPIDLMWWHVLGRI